MESVNEESRTLQEVFDSFTDLQKSALHLIVGCLVEGRKLVGAEVQSAERILGKLTREQQSCANHIIKLTKEKVS